MLQNRCEISVKNSLAFFIISKMFDYGNYFIESRKWERLRGKFNATRPSFNVLEYQNKFEYSLRMFWMTVKCAGLTIKRIDPTNIYTKQIEKFLVRSSCSLLLSLRYKNYFDKIKLVSFYNSSMIPSFMCVNIFILLVCFSKFISFS